MTKTTQIVESMSLAHLVEIEILHRRVARCAAVERLRFDEFLAWWAFSVPFDAMISNPLGVGNSESSQGE